MDLRQLRRLNKTRHSVSWGPAAAIAGSAAIFFGAQMLAGVALVFYALGRGWTTDQLLQWLTTATLGQFIFIFLNGAFTLTFLYVFLRSRKARPRDIGLKRPEVNDLWYTVGGFLGYFILMLIVFAAVQQFAPGINLDQEQEVGFNRDVAGAALVMVFVSLVILVPVVEETLVRGFMYSGLRSKLDMFPSILISSVVFGAAHLQWASDTPLLWVAAIDTFVLSLFLGFIREKSGSLWSPIGIHMIKNSIAFVVLFVFYTT